MRPLLWLSLLLCAVALTAAPKSTDPFGETVRPVLMENCAACHNPESPKNRIDFLKAGTVGEIQKQRGLWRNVSAQLRNRTMPPAASKLTEEDRMRVAAWIDEHLRETACNAGPFAGAVAVRRLNRREYRNTIRDLLGIDLPVSEIFPADGTGGEGFDTHGETLFVPPLLMERYLEAAQSILDRVIITPPLHRTVGAPQVHPPLETKNPQRVIPPGESVSASFTTFLEGEYSIKITLDRPKDVEKQVGLKIDGLEAGTLTFQRDPNGGATSRTHSMRLGRGVHEIEVSAKEHPLDFFSVTLEQKAQEPSAEKKAVHYRLFGMEPGETPVEPGKSTERLLRRFLRKAYRRPATNQDLSKLMALYDRAAERGDPYEERVKLALKGALVSPSFLFRIEQGAEKPGIYPVGQYEMASRLSYFFWSTMPDEDLLRLAGEGKLQDEKVLMEQVERMLDDPRSRSFANSFIGQWLGTKDVGGRVAPTVNAVQHYYTPEVAADMREEPILLFHHILSQDRSLIELLNADYTFLTERLVKFYELEDQVQGVQGNVAQLVHWPDQRRRGVFGLGAVLAMTSHFQQTSPVLRGAWVLETLLGTPVPAPPPEVPPLETEENKNTNLTLREKLMQHRADPSCSACHNLMDPIGFGLENFDWLGRWRETDEKGRPLDTKGELPSGEKFTGPVELREVLLEKKDDFVRHLTGKVLGYALGRSLADGDHCTIQNITDKLATNDYPARMLIREVVLSVPFRNTQGGLAPEEPVAEAPKRKVRRIEK